MSILARARVWSDLSGFGLALLAVYGCTDGPTPPDTSGEVLLPLAAVLPAGASSAVSPVDRWRVQVFRGEQEVVAEESGSFPAGQTTAEITVSVPLQVQCENLWVRVELWAGTALYYVGEVTLRACVGEEPRVQEVVLAPGPGLPGPDLEVTSLTAVPGDPTSDDPVTVIAVVENLDPRGAEPSVLWIRLDGEPTPSAFNVPSLAQGQAFQVQRDLGVLEAGVHTVTTVADAVGQLAESNEDNNERGLSLQVTPAPRPDLVVSALTHAPSVPNTEDPVTVTAIVRNDGNAASGPSVLRFQLDGGNASNHDVPSLPPGESHEVQRFVGILPAGPHTVLATADVSNAVVESNEGNNQRRDDFDAALALWPDLVVSDLTHSPANPTTANSVTVTAVVRNDGRADAGASTLRLRLDGGTATVHTIPALAPGATYQVVRSLGALPAGSHTVSAAADDDNAVAESNEGNNQATDNFMIGEATWPDLVVSSLTHSPINPTTESSVTVTAIVRNAGDVSAGASLLHLLLDGKSATSHDVPSLAPGATYQVQRVLGALASGGHSVTATADAANEVSESDEGNNQRSDDFDVTVAVWPDLVVSTLAHSPANPTTDNLVSVAAVVRNAGSAAAGTSVLRLLLDGKSATSHDVPSLAPGATYQVQRVLGTLSSGNHTVVATADVNNTVAESNERNNEATDLISVTQSAPPQLWVSTDSLAFWSPVGGVPAAETFTVRNTGGGTLNWNYSITDSGAGCVFSVLLSPGSGSLGPGASATVSVQLQGSCPLGTNLSNRTFTIHGSDGSSVPFVLTYLVVPSLAPATWNPRYSVSGVNTCTLPAGTGSWFTIRFDFEDREGDVGSSVSTVNVSYRFSTGTTGSYSHPPGDPYISYSGTGYAGTVRTDPCYRFGSATYVDVTLTLVDGGGHASNTVTVRMTRPSGANVPEPASSGDQPTGSEAGGAPSQPPAIVRGEDLAPSNE